MEGTMDNRRLTFARPTNRSVTSRRSASSSQTAPVEKSVVVPARDTLVQSTDAPHFSQLTPIYKSGPTKTLAEVARPDAQGLEFIKPTKKATRSSQVQRAIAAELSQETPHPHSAHLENIDLDLLESIDVEHTINTLPVLASAAADQPINFFGHYFQSNSEARQLTSRIKDFIPKAQEMLRNIEPRHVRRLGIISAVTAVVIVGYIVLNGFVLNQHSTAAISQHAAATVVQAPALTEQSTADSSSNAPAASSTSTDDPKTLTIDKLGINASVESVGLTSTGAINTPANIWNAAWYNASAKPGQAGATFIDGHSSASGGALFGKLDTLEVGDAIKVTKNDGTVVNYTVALVNVVNRNDVNMGLMLQPYGGHTNGLNIMSCQGSWVPSESTLENRVLVYAVQS